MTAGKKQEQFMALMPPRMLARLDALRVVLWTSRAEVNRRALDGQGLGGLEVQHVNELARLSDVAKRADVGSEQEFVKQLVAGKQRVPQLEELEKLNRTKLRELLKP